LRRQYGTSEHDAPDLHGKYRCKGYPGRVFRNIYHLPGKEYASETEVIDFVKKKIAEQKYDPSKTL
jgi:hypothetical protein